MTELGPAARNLIRAVGHADDPSDADQKRVRRALTTSLGAALLVGTTAGGAAASGSVAATGLVTKAIPLAQLLLWFGAGATGGVVAVSVAASSWRSAPVANSPRVVVTGSSAREVAPPQTAPISDGLASDGLAEPRKESPRPVPYHPPRDPVHPLTETKAPELTDTSRVGTSSTAVAAFPQASSAFSEEVRLLERAQRSLATGRCDDSLRSLDEYARRFPRGVLESESLAVRILCLCELGRDAEARVLLDRMREIHPESIQPRQLRPSCADETKE